MKIYYKNNVLSGWIDSDNEIYFDSHTNPSLLVEVFSNPSDYLIINGILTKDGQTVTINPPCEDCQTLDSIDTATTVEQLRKALQLMRDKPGFTKG